MLPLLNHLHAATSQTSALRVQLADMAVVVCLGYHLGILLCVGFSFGGAAARCTFARQLLDGLWRVFS